MKLNNKIFAFDNIKAFSVAEAMIALLIGSIALGMAAPMITKQVKQNNYVDAERRIIDNKINNIIPNGAIMFFRTSPCPDGWAPVTGLGGFYPRIADVNQRGTYIDENPIDSTLEQMVHKHKHVSPYSQAIYSQGEVNSFRYGPFRNGHSLTDGKTNAICGDHPDCKSGGYPELKATRANSKDENEKEYDINTGAGYLIRSFTNNGQDFNNWFTYTSDGVNRVEYISVGGGDAVAMPICPNRADDDDTNGCKQPYSFLAKYDKTTRTIHINNQPYLENMPLVGEENRPNSVVWLACEKVDD